MTDLIQATVTATVVAGLERSTAAVRAAFAADPAALARPYAAGKWTGRQMLLHIVDCESAFLDRVKRTLADAKPLLWALDPDRWNARLVFPDRSLLVSQQLFEAQRALLNEFVSSLVADEWQRCAVHNEAGKLSLHDLLAKFVSHTEHHLEQVEATVAGRTWIAQSR